MPNRYEQQFLDALRDLFVGAKVEGESGYINLMKIKARYFEQGVLPRLQADVEAVCAPFEPSFREELFDKLYDFFKRYFSESGSIYFRSTPLHERVYEKVYTDDRDVMLFWKTHMLYYVKTDRLFQSMDVAIEDTAFYFDVTNLQHKRANEKRELMYALDAVREGKIVLRVTYSEKGRKTKAEEILKELKAQRVKLDEETLMRAFRVFEKQSEVDYFINKNAIAFLREQFDLWLYQYVFADESQWTETRLRQLQALKRIAYHLIDFIAQFEDELVRVWNKPKFVLNSHYVVTVGRVTGDGGRGTGDDGRQRTNDVLERILAHAGMNAQVKEWRALGMVGDDFGIEQILEMDLTGYPKFPQFQFLPLDTKFFPDLELDILALFDNLDESLDGWLVHSENYQALNTLQNKFREKVQAIYIDPPYNTGNDGFAYRDKFRYGSWLTMMENRLFLANDVMSKDGVIYISIDDNQNANLKSLLEQVFEENEIATLVWHSKYTVSNDAKFFSKQHEYVYCFAKDIEYAKIGLLVRTQVANDRYSNPDNDARGAWKPTPLHAKSGTESSKYSYVFKNKTEWYPPQGRYPRFSKARLKELEQDNRIWFGKDGTNTPSVKTFLSEVADGVKSGTLLPYETFGHTHKANEQLAALLGKGQFDNPKPVDLVYNLVRLASDSGNETIFDFFAGSGTTAHAVINLNREDGGKRKYILVEMGEHFNTVILPRIKKVVFSDKWKDGRAQAGKGISQFVKYYDLEQYEDTLRRAQYADAPMFAAANPYNSYVFMRDLKFLDAITLDKPNDAVNVNLKKLYAGIDVAETLSNVTGKPIKRITRETVEFSDGTTASLTSPDWSLIKPLVWW